MSDEISMMKLPEETIAKREQLREAEADLTSEDVLEQMLRERDRISGWSFLRRVFGRGEQPA